MKKINELLAGVVNPISKKTLTSEDRYVSVEMKGSDLHVKYNREGIDPASKRKIEDEIISSLSSELSEDNIFILTISSESSDVYKAQGVDAPTDDKEGKPAEIKIGHGTVGEKKAIAGVKHILSIGSGKGGVGKSTFTANFAVTLAKRGYKVGVIDADIYGPSVPMMFNKRNQRPKANDEKKIIPLENYGIKFMSFGNFIHEDEPVVWRGPMLGGVLNQFFFETEWGELDYLLLDLPPGTGDVQLSMVQNLEVDGAIIISTPQDMALLDARKALHMFDKLDIHVVGMVENMSSFVCDSCNKEHFLYGTGGVALACSELGAGYLGKIPMDMGLRKGADFGKPYMEQSQKYEGEKVWKSYQEIAAKVDSYFNPDDNKKKSLLDKILKKH
jgi:ATP-binding protein involved in chromosome partitioning